MKQLSDKTFEELGVEQVIVDTLAKRGITKPFPIQAAVMADAMEGRDVLAKAPTGSGKTLGFSIPIVHLVHPEDPSPAALVLVPTRELAQQVSFEAKDIAEAHGLHVTAVYGGLEIRKQKSASHAHIVVATPGRLNDLVRRRLLSLRDVQILVLDEADRMLDMGFQPQVDEIVRHLPKDRQTMFFSATLDGLVGRIAQSYTRDAQRHEPGGGIVSPENRTHKFMAVTDQTKFQALVDLLAHERELALVFVARKNDVATLTYKLRQAGVQAAAMHGDLAQSDRESTLAKFERGDVTILVATDVAARGLDLDDITHVINYDPPNSQDEYVHRVGRTARAGRKGDAITLMLPNERGSVGRMAKNLGLEAEFIESGHKVVAARPVYQTKHRGGRRRF